jgi:hypothetical protein
VDATSALVNSTKTIPEFENTKQNPNKILAPPSSFCYHQSVRSSLKTKYLRVC